MKSQGGDEITTSELLNKLGYSKQQNSSKEDFTLIVPQNLYKSGISKSDGRPQAESNMM